jgi:type I restriction enzyme S subunit
MWALEGGVAVSATEGAVSTAYRVYQFAIEQVEPQFVHYLLRSLPALEQYRAMVRGVTTFDRSVTREDFEAMPIGLPPIREQRAIADFLDAETTRIDALIEKKRRMIELLEKRWRSAVEHRMVELAACYGTVSLRRLVQCLDGRRIPLSGEQRAERQSIYPYYGASGAIDQVDDYLFDEELVLLGEDGAQLADPDYEISFVVREKCWVNNHAHILRPLTADADFLALHLSTFDRFAFISGSTREKITQEDMWKITVPAIGFEAQCDEAQRLLRLKRKARELGDKLDYQIDLLTEHRQALITAAVTGQVDVSGV